MIENETRKVICKKGLEDEEIEQFKEAIDSKYIIEYYLGDEIEAYDLIGAKMHNDHYLKTHVEFNIYYNEDNNTVAYANVSYPKKSDFLRLSTYKANSLIEFSYNVNFFKFTEELIPEEAPAESIHWFAISNSFIFAISMVIFISVLLSKILKNDFQKFEDLDSMGDEVNWRHIRNEVLVGPFYKAFLCGFSGIGLQVLILSFNLLVLGILGIFYGHKGSFKTIAIILYCFTGTFNGYYSANLYKTMAGKHWALNLVIAITFLPCCAFINFSFLNSIAWASGATSALPFSAIMLVLLLGVLVYLPLSLLGGFTARMRIVEVVCKSERVLKTVPEVELSKSMWVFVPVSGLLPFTSIFLELYYLFNSTWGHKIYHLYGILFFAFILLIIVTSCVSITLTYFVLNNRDHRWWWKSFLFGGSSAGYFMLYSVYYYFFKSNMHGLLQFCFFFGYSSLFGLLAFLMLGSVGFISSLKFVVYVYNRSKLD